MYYTLSLLQNRTLIFFDNKMEEDNNTLISVIMPVYNAEKYLSRAIESVLYQSYKAIELLLINDCSTDNSLSICQKFSSTDKRVKIFNNKINSGSGFGKNYGIEHANGQFIMFIDDDDYIDRNIIENCINLQKTTNADIITFGYSDDDLHKGKDHYLLNEPKIISGKESVHCIFRKENVDSNPWGKIYRKKLLSNIRFPLNTFFDDINVVYKIFMNAEKVCISGICGYAHMDNGESISGSPFRNKDWEFISQTQILIENIRKNYPEYNNSVKYMMDEAVIFILMKYIQRGGNITKDQKKFLYRYYNENFKYYLRRCNNTKERIAAYTIKYRIYPILFKIKHRRH